MLTDGADRTGRATGAVHLHHCEAGWNRAAEAGHGGQAGDFSVAEAVAEPFRLPVGLGSGYSGVNRGGWAVYLGNVGLTLAHFKSGQNGLTEDQRQNAAGFLDGAQPARWAIIGDMNWDYRNKGALTVPGGAHASSCWPDMPQAKGGILSWRRHPS